ncbi:MAG: UDP-N-acetylmuramoyl-tripeptide--D-alanyl-D-alanine ligase [Capsulimonadaceae bacterium]
MNNVGANGTGSVSPALRSVFPGTTGFLSAALGRDVAGLDPGLKVLGVSTDTRTLRRGEVFVALRNDRADGHDFVRNAVDRGAPAVVVSLPIPGLPVPQYVVEDTEVAYGRLARVWRDQFDIPIVGVTGSVGKTSTKEMLACALRSLGPVLKTAASQNNETGVPKAVLGLTPAHRSAVVEMGMRGAGQIARLCEIARPTHGVVTLVAENHIELLGSRDAIADAKGELLDALGADGIAFLNVCDSYFPRLSKRASGKIVKFGVIDDYRTSPQTFAGESFIATDLRLVHGRWVFRIGGQDIEIASPGRHDVSNAAAAYAVAITLGVAPADAAAALAAYELPPMRLQIVDAPVWGGTVINDAYNAAPASMRAALLTLGSMPSGRKIAFLADMKELGDAAPAAHGALGIAIAEAGGLAALYTVGELAALIPGASGHFADSAEAARFAETLDLHAGDVVLVKGSRAMAMERVADALLQRGQESA